MKWGSIKCPYLHVYYTLICHLYWCMTQISKQLYGFELFNIYFEMKILNLKYAVFLHNEMGPLVQIQLCDKINIHLNYDKQKL